MNSEKISREYTTLSSPRETLTNTSSYDSHATLITDYQPRAKEVGKIVEQAGEETPRRGTHAGCERRTLALFRRRHPRNKTESPTRRHIRRRTSSPRPHRILPPTCYLTRPAIPRRTLVVLKQLSLIDHGNSPSVKPKLRLDRSPQLLSKPGKNVHFPWMARFDKRYQLLEIGMTAQREGRVAPPH